MNPDTSSHPAILKSIQTAAQAIGVKGVAAAGTQPEEFEQSFEAMTRERIEALILAPDTFYLGQRRRYADLALKNRMPTMFPFREQVAAGGLDELRTEPR